MKFPGLSHINADFMCDTMSSQELPVSAVFADWRRQGASCSAAALHALSPGHTGPVESRGPGEQFSRGHPGTNGSCTDRV